MSAGQARRNYRQSIKKTPSKIITVPISMHMNTMVCVEIPELHRDLSGPVPRVWARTKEEAERLKQRAIKNYIEPPRSKEAKDLAAAAKSGGRARAKVVTGKTGCSERYAELQSQ